MRLSYETIELKLRDPFRISRSITDSKKTVIVHIDEGIGEASPSKYYGETEKTVVAYLETIKEEIGDDPFQIESILARLGQKLNRNFAAKAGVDIALHDLLGKRLGIPIYKLLGLEKGKDLITSYTIGIDTIKKMQEKTKKAEGFLAYKVKVGVENDIKMVKAVREITDAKIRVDANAGWTVKESVEKINQLEELDIELVEQPIDSKDKDGLKLIREKTNLPIIIDEDLMTSKDIFEFAGIADGINIKLMKCGGIREALKMIHTARALNMKVMLGCMIESSVAITAAAHLASLVDYLDLDGNLLITNDPYSGVKLEKGKLILSDQSGLGVIPA